MKFDKEKLKLLLYGSNYVPAVVERSDFSCDMCKTNSFTGMYTIAEYFDEESGITIPESLPFKLCAPCKDTFKK